MILMFLKETFELRDVFSFCRSGGFAKSGVVAFGKSGCYDGLETVRILETFPDVDGIVRTENFRFGGRLLDCPHECFMRLGMTMPPSFDTLLLSFLKAFEWLLGVGERIFFGAVDDREEVMEFERKCDLLDPEIETEGVELWKTDSLLAGRSGRVSRHCERLGLV